MTTTTPTIKTRSKAPYALVAGYSTDTPRLVGYAYSTGPAAAARARRLSAKILPIVAGKVVVCSACLTHRHEACQDRHGHTTLASTTMLGCAPTASYCCCDTSHR